MYKSASLKDLQQIGNKLVNVDDAYLYAYIIGLVIMAIRKFRLKDSS